MKQLVFESEGEGKIAIPSNALLVWLDETGHELFADKKYPLFGLGGCVVEAKNYIKLVRKPWKGLKYRAFDGAKQLHVADFRNPTEQQLLTL